MLNAASLKLIGVLEAGVRRRLVDCRAITERQMIDKNRANVECQNVSFNRNHESTSVGIADRQ